MSDKNNNEKLELEDIDKDGNIFIPISEKNYINGLHILRFNEFKYIYNFIEKEKEKELKIDQFIDYLSRLRAEYPSNTSPYLTTDIDHSDSFKLSTLTYINEDGVQFGRSYKGGVRKFIIDIFMKTEQIIRNLEYYKSKLDKQDPYKEHRKFSKYGDIKIEQNGDIRFRLKDYSLSDFAKFYDDAKSKSGYKTKKGMLKDLHKVLVQKDYSPFSIDSITQAEYKVEKKNINNKIEKLKFLEYLLELGKKNKTFAQIKK